MTARTPAPDFRHLSVWPARGARYGDGSLTPAFAPGQAAHALQPPQEMPEAQPRPTD
ncbi:hypothetical protein [Vannielia litorea]|uniref:hypothetical protein n=1 Tax=Vannielia litorea TaxID=1217970 RepID=UPI001BD08EFA|nr:hypothetical protein [Vannielia litorea]